jgi:hypothetical protein
LLVGFRQSPFLVGFVEQSFLAWDAGFMGRFDKPEFTMAVIGMGL